MSSKYLAVKLLSQWAQVSVQVMWMFRCLPFLIQKLKMKFYLFSIIKYKREEKHTVLVTKWRIISKGQEQGDLKVCTSGYLPARNYINCLFIQIVPDSSIYQCFKLSHHLWLWICKTEQAYWYAQWFPVGGLSLFWFFPLQIKMLTREAWRWS